MPNDFYGWIDPTGMFHQVDFGEHTGFAMDLTENDEEFWNWVVDKKKLPSDAKDYMVEVRGWVLIENMCGGVPILTYNLSMVTRKQIEEIMDIFNTFIREIPFFEAVNY